MQPDSPNPIWCRFWYYWLYYVTSTVFTDWYNPKLLQPILPQRSWIPE
jgi:hypothetical protein